MDHRHRQHRPGPTSAGPLVGHGALRPRRRNPSRSDPGRPGRLLVVACLALLLGALLYRACRPGLPWLLDWLGGGSAPVGCPGPLGGWWPSALHAFAFTCLLGVAMGGARRIALGAGAFWVSVAVLAELACLGGTLYGSRALFPGGLGCRADPLDVLAATAGAALAIVLFPPGARAPGAIRPTPN